MTGDELIQRCNAGNRDFAVTPDGQAWLSLGDSSREYSRQTWRPRSMKPVWGSVIQQRRCATVWPNRQAEPLWS